MQTTTTLPGSLPDCSNLRLIAEYMMPSLPPCPSDLGFLFGTRHGVGEFCEASYALWQEGMFSRLLVSGGQTMGLPRAEAEVIGENLIKLGLPESALILETVATNTGENVCFGRARVAEVMNVSTIRSVVVIGKICSARRYLMTLQRHWPGLRMSVCPVNYFGVPAERWHEHDDFRGRVLSEFNKIPRYVTEGFITEINGCEPYPRAAGAGVER
ncbi:YdcF family protein [Massilia niabensis]|uniref:YdcF family protein n=1 Tax=Massilia niabensis TaxID=544910 RepID=A0ABW0L7K1_9BURK